MGIYFGTDGFRGKFNDDLTISVAYNLGNALGSEKYNAKILIGRDTRSTGSILTLAFACGAMSAGASIVDVGVCPTATISFLITKMGFDFGVMVSASHNPAEYNGIKIFDKTGRKISEKVEENLERKFIKHENVNYNEIGTYQYKPQFVDDYVDFLINLFDFSLKNIKIVLDCSNGASSFIAQKIFKSKGAKVIVVANSPNGVNINDSCGALHISNLKKYVKLHGANFGFAFDGDADRLIAVDENGDELNGDLIIYIFAKFFKIRGELSNFSVVGTRHTNLGVEKALNREGIKLIRTEIGDKYVSSKLYEQNLLLGGEQSGHIIVQKYLPTGDGLLSALLLSYIIVCENKKLSKFIDFKPFKQTNINVFVKNKVEVINSEKLSLKINEINSILNGIGRVMVRVSGTEPCIRVMVETEDDVVSQKYANEIALIVKQVDSEINLCVE